MKNLILIICVSIIFLSCKDKMGCWDVRQAALKFAISDSNSLFRLYPKDSIRFNYNQRNFIYYFDENGLKKYMEFTGIGMNDQNNDPKYYISVGDIAELSSGTIKNYYINWPNGEIDTLYSNYKNENCPYNNSCGCSNPLVELKLNGKSFVRKTNYDINGIFIFDR